MSAGGGGDLLGLDGDGACDEVGVGVEGDEGIEDGGFDDIGADAFSVAGGLAVALAGEAGVVAVAMPSSGGGDPDVVPAALPAGDEPGEEVVGVGVGHAPVVALAALGEDALGSVEQVGVDEGLVGLVADVAEGDLAEIAAVAQDEEHRLGGPTPAASRAAGVGVELCGDGGGSGLVGAVAGEDAFDEGNSVGSMARGSADRRGVVQALCHHHGSRWAALARTLCDVLSRRATSSASTISKKATWGICDWRVLTRRSGNASAISGRFKELAAHELGQGFAVPVGDHRHQRGVVAKSGSPYSNRPGPRTPDSVAGRTRRPISLVCPTVTLTPHTPPISSQARS
ncbi:MAG: hypothetical protein M0Z33_03450 [Actinomycetota bacterium]|nr:hypothetical protein [Actinomycetota bacterium]